MVALSSLIGTETLHNLLDSKSVDRRITGACEVEMNASRVGAGSPGIMTAWLDSLLTAVSMEMHASASFLFRRCGQIILASVCLGLRSKLDRAYLRRIIEACCKGAEDEEASVRYSCCESLYNIVKVVQFRAFVAFDCIFATLAKLTGDAEIDNRQTSVVLDRLLRKTIVDSTLSPDEVAVVWRTVEIHMVSPNPIAKQLCLDWVRFLRGVNNSEFEQHLPYIFPSLICLVSAHESPSNLRQDLAIQAEELLARGILEGLEKHELSVALVNGDILIDVLTKYGTFQESLNSRAQVLLFRYIAFFGPILVQEPARAGALISVITQSTGLSDDPVVNTQISQANTALLRSTAFCENLSNCDELVDVLMPLLNNLKCNTMQLERIVEWLSVTAQRKSHHLNDRIDILNILLAILMSPSNLKAIKLRACKLVGSLYSVKSFGNDFACAIASMYGGMSEGYNCDIEDYLCAVIEGQSHQSIPSLVMSIVAEFESTKEQQNPLLLALAKCISTKKEFQSLRDSFCKVSNESRFGQDLLEAYKLWCPVGYICLALCAGRYSDMYGGVCGLGLSSSDSSQLECVIDILESESQLHHRLAIARNATESTVYLVNALREIGMRLNKDSGCFTTLARRLQLVHHSFR